MGGFLYFWPTNEKSINSAGVKALGLEYAFPKDGGITYGGLPQGPEGSAGVIFKRSIKTETGPLGFDADKQVWRKGKGGKYWLGYEKEHPPKPEDLIKKEHPTENYLLDLGDGNEWLCPIARALPSYMGMNDNDERVLKTKPEYTHLSEIGDKYFKWFLSQENENKDERERLSVIDESAMALKCLQANYHIGDYEADLLHLLDERTRQVVMLALIGISAQDSGAEEAKKKEG